VYSFTLRLFLLLFSSTLCKKQVASNRQLNILLQEMIPASVSDHVTEALCNSAVTRTE